MMNCLGFLNDNNCYLWLLIIILIICCGGCGCITNIIEKICNCGCLIPILLVLLCVCGGNKGGMREHKGFNGCGCK
ncbi:MAG: chorion class high-cysteine HCB protein 13 [Clostridia bacterium]|nr:chorion class high-cysteine HCB protein 13 [Clostridia bacterium]